MQPVKNKYIQEHKRRNAIHTWIQIVKIFPIYGDILIITSQFLHVNNQHKFMQFFF